MQQAFRERKACFFVALGSAMGQVILGEDMQTLSDAVVQLWRMRQLLWALTWREIEGRYAGTVLGVAWMYIQPLCSLAAFYLVFDVVMGLRLGPDAPAQSVGAFLVVGALPWMALSDSIARGTSSLLEAGGLLQKNALPPALFPTRAVLGSAVVYAPLMALLVLVYTPLHGWQWPVVFMLLLLAAQLLLGMLLAHVLAIFAVAMRDTSQIVGFALSLGIYLAPILFPLKMIPEAVRWVLWLNPVTPLVIGYQHVLLQGVAPPWQIWLALAVWLVLLATVLSVLMRRCYDQLVDWL